MIQLILAGVTAAVILISGHRTFADDMKRQSQSTVTNQESSRAAKRDASRIIRGQEARPGAYPFQVLVTFVTSRGQSWCGGSLVHNAEWVLTAAHCVTDTDGSVIAPDKFEVFVGSEKYKKGERIPVKQVRRYEGYDAQFIDNDLALLQLVRTPSAETRYGVIRFIQSSQEAEFGKPGTRVTVIGWGGTETGRTSTVLLEGRIKLVDRATCNKSYLNVRLEAAEAYLAEARAQTKLDDQIDKALSTIGRLLRLDDAAVRELRQLVANQAPMSEIHELGTRKAGAIISDSMICAGEPAPEVGTTVVTDSCHGDSGGPLFAIGPDGKPVQVGVVSWGEGGRLGCGSPTLSGVYTRLAKFADWMNEILK